MGGGRRSDNSSSGEEDGDAEWRAAIDSVTAVASSVKNDSNGTSYSSSRRSTHEDEEHKPQIMKHYQIKAQKMLDDLIEKSIEVVTDKSRMLEKDPPISDAGVRLFRNAPSGIVFDQTNELHGPKTRPRIVPGEVFDEKSKRFRKRLKSVAVDGTHIIDVARAAGQKSLAKMEARESAAKAAAKRDEERVAELKKIRGERWLPSIARQMKFKTSKC
ncbi:hypothetical protein ABFS82_08G058100 [Erythranthe guttata]|uniref:Uncharacterized protein n=1 Tax=Erythranthe guttata TaxID=4155 RepID=A0A022RXS9_ERYGU|nr:PREDICTED: uncharacterized protein LOC105973484 [Erythranthe guttata]EYU44493.1 hypothetical protein MIMGU_mgv1a013596mg [Erythranthe guttata]|eukprot:XP_012853970.1 PREDICTED: uncharacterized protein LOC105973484 [Erythranthe guttata]